MTHPNDIAFVEGCIKFLFFFVVLKIFGVC